MTKNIFPALVLGITLLASTAQAQEDKQDRPSLSEAEKLELLAEREAMMASIERSRQEVERAAEEARVKARVLREEAQRLRAESAELAQHNEQQREAARAELAREREELSRTHRELRRASQEVARAHRELGMLEDRRNRTRFINLGDRAILGVILGDETGDGIRIMGISPDGPAERAGLQSGDTLISLRGEGLGAAAGKPPRETIFQIMNDVGEGEEISAKVLRNGEVIDFMIKPERREPASWASYIRLPDPVVAPSAPSAAGAPVAPAAPVAPHVAIERIAVPPVDTAVLAAEAMALADELENFHIVIQGDDGESMEYSYEFNMDPSDFEFDTEAFSEIGSMALDEARVWFGAGATMGIHFTEINEGLAAYFDTDSGLLVLDAPSDNAFGLMAGDVVLKVDNSDINATSDFIRALRGHESGDAVVVEIKRNKRTVSLDAVIPENRFGMFQHDLLDGTVFATLATENNND